MLGFIAAPAPLEMLVILVVALIVLGPKRLPEAARSLGRGMRELKESFQGISEDDYEEEAHRKAAVRDDYEDEPEEPALEDEPVADDEPAAKPLP